MGSLFPLGEALDQGLGNSGTEGAWQLYVRHQAGAPTPLRGLPVACPVHQSRVSCVISSMCKGGASLLERERSSSVDWGHTWRGTWVRGERGQDEHRAPRPDEGGSMPAQEDRALEVVMEARLDPPGSPRRATCPHQASGTQEGDCVMCVFQDSADLEPLWSDVKSKQY